jgi:hypothetical protein
VPGPSIHSRLTLNNCCKSSKGYRYSLLFLRGAIWPTWVVILCIIVPVLV